MITIIVPVYNAQHTLKRCIESILLQTYSDFELLLVDDGSVDNSGDICDNYCRRDARVRVIHQRNQGASLARKNGIMQSRGEYLTFVDADDFLESDYLALLLDALVKNPAVRIAACGVLKRRQNEYVVPADGTLSIIKSEELFRRFFSYEFWGFWGKLYQCSVFDDIFIPSYTINEDYVVMAQIFQRYKEIVYVSTDLYNYVVSDNSLSHQDIGPRAIGEYYNKMWVVSFFRKYNSQYVAHAEAQLMETCVKLIGQMQKADKVEMYKEEYGRMRSFLRSHVVSIICNPNILIGLKFMVIKCIF